MKLLTFILTGAVVVSLAGCTHDEAPGRAAEDGTLHRIRVDFQLGGCDASLSGEGRNASRAGVADHTFIPDGVLLPQSEPPRKVLSSNNWQQVNDVRIYVFRKNTAGNFVYYKPLDDNGSKRDYLSVEDFSLKFDLSPYVIWWGGADDTNEAHAFTGRLNLPSGEYRFLALARDDRTVTSARRLMDPNIAVSTWGWAAWSEATTRLETATLACARNTELSATELFSGYTSESLVVDGSTTHFTRTITLNRAVAGILLYVEYIPATIRTQVCNASGSTVPQNLAVKSLAVVHGKTVSDQVLIASRSAVAGRLPATTSGSTATTDTSADDTSADDTSTDDTSTDDTGTNSGANSGGSSSTLPLPRYVLLRADIPAQAQVLNGVYVNLSPGNTAHPHALLKGAFVMPQAANPSTGSGSGAETYDKSLYLVFLGYDASQNREIALEWRPIRFADAEGEGCDPLHYPLLANHFYSIGSRRFSLQSGALQLESDSPVDLRDETSAAITIRLEPCWDEYYGGEFGNPAPGVALDPDWGEHPGGELGE